MKTIFLTIYDGGIAKNILRTDVFKALKREKGLRIILLISVPEKVDYYRKEFGGPNVIVEGISNPKLNKLHYALLHLFFSAFPTETIKIEQVRKLFKDKNILRFLIFRLAGLFMSNRPARTLLRAFDSFIFSGKEYQYLFDKYKPDLLFATNIIAREDIGLIRQARKNNVFTVAMVKSWDNPTTKGMIRGNKADRLIVHNETLKKEMIELHDFPPEKIYVAGIPHFDIYTDNSKLSRRKEFFNKIGADLNKKLIFFCAAGDDIAPNDPEVLEILDKLIEEGTISFPVQILVRPHPKYPGVDETARRCKNTILDRPGIRVTQSFSSWEFEEKDIIHLFNSLYHCDLMINTASTTTIEACIFDKPVINIGFDGFKKKNFYQSVERFYSFTHYQSIVRTGGIRVVKNKEELAEAVNSYLSNPQLDREDRKKIKQEQCFKLDGKSGERVAKFVLNMLNSKHKNES